MRAYSVEIALGIERGKLDQDGLRKLHGFLELRAQPLALAELPVRLENLPRHFRSDLVTAAAVDDEGAWRKVTACVSTPRKDNECMSVRLTVRLDHLSAARAAEDDGASTFLHGGVGVLVVLLLCQIGQVPLGPSSATHGELTESERHAVGVATNLDEDSAVPTKLTSDGGLEGAVILRLRETVEIDC